jgi:hypothetical protein
VPAGVGVAGLVRLVATGDVVPAEIHCQTKTSRLRLFIASRKAEAWRITVQAQLLSARQPTDLIGVSERLRYTRARGKRIALGALVVSLRLFGAR